MESLTKEKLKIENLCKTFEDGKGAVSSASFTVNNGEFLSILGPSGCGKTTILRMLIGLIPPTSGSIYKDGEDITHFPPSKRGMGIVFQNYALFNNMTVLENVEYALKVKKETKATARETALEYIEKMGLIEHKDKKPNELSGGQQQRVAIARTLVLKPDIILFDEPMSALDIATRLTLRAELKALQKEFAITMIYITHDQEEAFSMSDRIMVMDKSVIVQIGTPEEILSSPATEYVQSFVVDNLKAKVDALSKFVGLSHDSNKK
ncbi:MAG: ABC transporter ATP-binding protein [Clostridia bacterium]|nr:ABC transporter ATP-binding protein [Clostridia bacterium]